MLSSPSYRLFIASLSIHLSHVTPSSIAALFFPLVGFLLFYLFFFFVFLRSPTKRLMMIVLCRPSLLQVCCPSDGWVGSGLINLHLSHFRISHTPKWENFAITMSLPNWVRKKHRKRRGVTTITDFLFLVH